MGYSSSLAGIGRSYSGYSMTWIQGIVCTVFKYFFLSQLKFVIPKILAISPKKVNFQPP